MEVYKEISIAPKIHVIIISCFHSFLRNICDNRFDIPIGSYLTNETHGFIGNRAGRSVWMLHPNRLIDKPDWLLFKVPGKSN